jgi:hypothetical protein
MALTFTELESITDDYFMADNKMAADIYFDDSFGMHYYMNLKKGLWERPPGGRYIRIPLEYDCQVSGVYDRSDSLDSTDRESINAAKFGIKHYYGNATIYRTDELQNVGEYAEVQMVVQRVKGAQKSCRKLIADNFYSAAADTSKHVNGLRAMCGETTSVTYGDIAEADLSANDGTTPWEGKTNTTEEVISLDVIRTLRSDAKISDGPNGKPDAGFTTETLFNKISAILQVQQRFTTDSETAKAGFTHVVFEGMILAADDYCPSGYLFGVNSRHAGFGIHQKGYFVRTPWANLQSADVMGRSMKILWDGNWVCNNRKAHKAHSNLS